MRLNEMGRIQVLIITLEKKMTKIKPFNHIQKFIIKEGKVKIFTLQLAT